MIELEINGKGNKVQLIKMLAYIEFCGNIGHTPKYLKVYIDGDGKSRRAIGQANILLGW